MKRIQRGHSDYEELFRWAAVVVGLVLTGPGLMMLWWGIRGLWR